MSEPDAPDVHRARAIARAIETFAALSIVAVVLFRATAAFDAFPFWSLDPLQSPGVQTALTPAATLTLDAIVLAFSAIVLLAAWLRRDPIGVAAIALFLLGTVSIAAHAWLLDGASLDDLVTGATWASSLAGGLALFHAARDERTRRIAVSSSVGLVVLLVAKGALQYFVEHRQTLEEFQKHRDAFLASQGMTPGSIAARTFERRLVQPEATGWFGLSNVFASFSAALAVALTGFALRSPWRVSVNGSRRTSRQSLALALGSIAGIVGVVLAGSKGGFAVLALGLALTFVLFAAGRWGELFSSARAAGLSMRLHRAAPFFAPLLVLLTLLAVAARGLIGQRVHELSLLFRWFYMQGATRIALSHPLWGVGPSGFKEAYMLAKPAISPEEVTSPHSVLLDWWATLGIFGLAWVALWISWIVAIGRRIVEDFEPGSPAGARAEIGNGTSPARHDARLIGIVVAAAAIASTWVERDTLVPGAAIVRILGLFAWLALSLACAGALQAKARGTRAAMAIGVLMIAIHSQIEVTSIWANSAPLALLLLGLAGAPAIDAAPRPRARAIAPIGALTMLIGALGLGALGARPVFLWQRDLRDAARIVAPLADIRQRLGDVAAAGGRTESGDTMGSIATSVGDLLGQFPPQDAAAFDRALETATAARTERAAIVLQRALDRFPAHIPTREALVRLMLARAAALVSLGQREQALAIDESAERLADGAAESSAGLLLRGNTLQARGDLERDPKHLERSLAIWERAALLDPYGISVPWRAFRTARTLGRDEDSRLWARRALAGEQYQRLDPLRRLTDEQRREVEGVLAKPPAAKDP